MGVFVSLRQTLRSGERFGGVVWVGRARRQGMSVAKGAMLRPS